MRRHQARTLIKQAIVHNNLDLFREVLKDGSLRNSVDHKCDGGKKIVEIVRTNLGYSKNTYDWDILSQIRRSFEEYEKTNGESYFSKIREYNVRQRV